jgi:hypothetical protein
MNCIDKSENASRKNARADPIASELELHAEGSIESEFVSIPESLVMCDGADACAKAPAASSLSVSLRAATALGEYSNSLNIAANKLGSNGGQNSACHVYQKFRMTRMIHGFHLPLAHLSSFE